MCQVAHQIQRRYGPTPFNPLDWVGTSFSALSKLFADDGTHLAAVDVEVLDEAAVNLSYGLNYYHEFPRNPDRVPVITETGLTVCRRKMRRKHLHFVKRIADNERTLFVRLLGHHDRMDTDYKTPDPRPLCYAEINELVRAIEKRFPGLPFHLALVRIPQLTKLRGDERLDNRVIFHTIPPFQHWKGDDGVWDQVFDLYRIKSVELVQPDVTKEYLHP